MYPFKEKWGSSLNNAIITKCYIQDFTVKKQASIHNNISNASFKIDFTGTRVFFLFYPELFFVMTYRNNNNCLTYFENTSLSKP